MYTVFQYQPTFKKLGWRQIISAFTVSILLAIMGCGSSAKVRQEKFQRPLPKPLPPIGYTIQAGAFANISNAVRFAEKLQTRGLQAYHFRDSAGLYKVRIGNYPTDKVARLNGERLKAAGIIDTYFLVGPKDYAATGNIFSNKDKLRDEIVNTAKKYIGVNYRWGGQSGGTGFDCSGLTMVVYSQNGLQLPRSSRQQWKAGKSVNRGQLSKGDLVFFATTGGKKVSHVGIYIGNDEFLHAPGRGREIRVSSLTNKYFKSRYLGARTYL